MPLFCTQYPDACDEITVSETSFVLNKPECPVAMRCVNYILLEYYREYIFSAGRVSGRHYVRVESTTTRTSLGT